MTNHASHFQVTRGPTLMQINVEGLTKAKREVIQHLAKKHRASGILLQETHSTKDEQLQIHGFNNEHHSCNTSPQTWYCHIRTIGRTEWSRRDVAQQRSSAMDCCVYRRSNDNERVQASEHSFHTSAAVPASCYLCRGLQLSAYLTGLPKRHN